MSALPASTADRGTPTHGEAVVALARKLRLDNRLDEAEETLRAFLAEQAGDHAGWMEHAACRRRRGDLDGALVSFSKAAAALPAHLGAKVEVASTLRALDRLPEAAELLDSVLAADPRRTEALIERGHLARRQGDHTAALAAFEAAAGNHPDHLGIQLEVVRSLRQTGRLDDAATRLAELAGRHPRDLGILIETGHVARRRGDEEEALAAFRAAGTIDPAHEGIRNEAAGSLAALAAAAWSAGDPARSATLLDEALTLHPAHAGALLARAEQALAAEDPERAMRYARRAAEAHPKLLEALLLGARAAARIPEAGKAAEFLDEAENRFGTRAEILASRVHVLRALGDHRAAGKVIARAGPLAGHESLWAEVVSYRIFDGDFDGARSILDGLPPGIGAGAHAAFFRGLLAEGRRDYDGALAAYGAALVGEPGNGVWHAETARAALLALDVDRARDHLRRAMQFNAAASITRGQSLNPSQHHTGQVIDEFALDSALLARLQAACRLAKEERLPALKALVRGNPDSTAAAIMLMLELQRRGALAARADAAGSPVPRRVAQFWDRRDPPADIRRLMASWNGGEGFEYHLFDERSAEAFLRRNAGREVARAFRRAGHPAQRADIFRLAWLAREGGIYADADDRRLAPLADLLPAGAAFVAYQENYGSIANNFLAAVPDHPVIVAALDLAATAVNRGDRDFVWLATGPGLVTRALAGALAAGDGPDAGSVVVRELHEMHRLVAIHCPVAYKSTGAHWSRAVFSRLRPRSGRVRQPAGGPDAEPSD